MKSDYNDVQCARMSVTFDPEQALREALNIIDNLIERVEELEDRSREDNGCGTPSDGQLLHNEEREGE